jgi:hypothetical protein
MTYQAEYASPRQVSLAVAYFEIPYSTDLLAFISRVQFHFWLLLHTVSLA